MLLALMIHKTKKIIRNDFGFGFWSVFDSTPWNSIIEGMPCFLVYAAGTTVLNTKLVIIIHSHLLLFAPLISEEFPYQFPWGCFQIKEKLATTPHRIPQSQIKCGAARLFVKLYQIHTGFWNSPNSGINVNIPN